jgi:hypothetical protein
MSNTYKVGTSVESRAQFFDEFGVALDPPSVVAKVQTPEGVETSYTYGVDAAVVRETLGVYHLWIETLTAGIYVCRWKGDGSVRVANEKEFNVTASKFIIP